MKENLTVISTKVIQIGLVVLAFLIPFFFLPITSEFYNFNKTFLLTAGSFFLFFVWGVKMVAEGRVRMTRTPLDIPLLIFLGVYLLATMFSIDPIVSILGWHPTFFYSLPSIAALIILYFLATTHLDSTYRQATYIAFAVSASILAAVVIAQYFGHFLLGTDWSAARNWNPAGDINKMAAFLAITIPVTVALALSLKEAITRYFAYILTALQIIAIALVNILFAYIALAVAALAVLLFLPRLRLGSEEKSALGILIAVLVAVTLLVNVPALGDGFLKPLISGDNKSINLDKPIKLPQSVAWETSAAALAKRPIFGSGPSTYAMAYPQFKPLDVNRINENNLWNIRFDEPGSGILNILATTGAAGIIVFLLILIVLIRSLVSFSTGNEVVKSKTGFLFLQASLVAAIVTFLLFNITPLTGLAFVLLAAGFYTTARDWGSRLASEVDLQLVALRAGALRSVEADSSRKSAGSDSLAWAFLIPALALFVAIAFLSWTNYKAESSYQKAILLSQQQNKGRETRDALVAAINTNPYRDTYHRALLITDLALARALNQRGNLSEEEQNTLLALVREAIDQGRITTGYEGRGLGSFQIKRGPGTSVRNVANWEAIAIVYASIGGELRPDATVHAINTFSQAIRLDPTNPRLYEALGNVYMNLGDVDNAIRNYELAVSAKFDYASGHYNLAQAVKRKGDNPARVVNELQATLNLLEDNEQNKENKTRIEQELKEAREKLRESQQQTGQPTTPVQLQEATPSATPGQ